MYKTRETSMKQCIVTILASLCLMTAAQASTPPYIDSDNLATLLEQGNIAWSEQKLEQAEQSFRQAIELDPDSSQAHANLAGLLQSMNRSREAVEEYQTAITLDTENPRLFVALAISYLHLRSYSMAQAMADEALRLDPEMANAKKLIEYIEARKEVIKRAADADTSSQTSVEMPADPPAPAAHY